MGMSLCKKAKHDEKNGGAAKNGPLTKLVKIAEKACFSLAPFVQAVYEKLQNEKKLMTVKADKSYFTIADALVQEATMILFPSDKFKAFCGEEAQSDVNVSKRPYSVKGMELPENIADAYDKAMTEIKALCSEVDSKLYQDIELFVDPIDGTKEFCKGLGEQCTICIGFVRDGLPVAGIVFRPILNNKHTTRTFMSGCKEEGYSKGLLNKTDAKSCNPSVLTSNGSISKYVEVLIEELKFERYKAGGCGNKCLLLLEGKDRFYIQDRGVSRWDTCAAQAVMEANEGVLCKLRFVVEEETIKSYTYRVGKTNPDFNEKAVLSKYNVVDQAVLKDPVSFIKI